MQSQRINFMLFHESLKLSFPTAYISQAHRLPPTQEVETNNEDDIEDDVIKNL